jgi:hypothetical protein
MLDSRVESRIIHARAYVDSLDALIADLRLQTPISTETAIEWFETDVAALQRILDGIDELLDN